MNTFIAIDGGGTKTDAVLFSTAGQVLGRHIGPGCNPNDMGFEPALQALSESVRALPIPSGAISGVFAGISGAIAGDCRERFQQGLRLCLPGAQAVSVHGDIVPAITSGLIHKSGCLLICGTGCVAFARPIPGDNENLVRCGGWGHLLDKSGSGYDLGRDALHAALCAYDGRSPAGAISELVELRLGRPVHQAVDQIYKNGKSFIASFAPVIFEAVRQGDLAALNILRENMAGLSNILNAAAAHIPGDSVCQTVLCGGVFKEFSLMEGLIRDNLSREHHFIPPKLPPVYGSAIQALGLAGISPGEGFQQRFAESLSSLGT